MTPEQMQAATLLHHPISVMASAGSGKTTTMVERYLNLLKAGFSPRSILTVTFTKEAAEQLRDRILEGILQKGLDPKWEEQVLNSSAIGTLHSLCYSVLNQYGNELGLPPVSQIIDDFAFYNAFEKHYQDWLSRLPTDSLNPLLDHFTHRELKTISQMIYKNRYLFFDCLRLAQDAGAKDIGAPVLVLLGKELKALTDSLSSSFHKKGHYSFDDLEHLCLRILKESTLARARLCEEYQQILVDEFQDTSPVQWQILTLLLGDNLNKLFIVGDPKQSIYGFRQAEPALFAEVTQLMSYRGGKQIDLIQNFRTQPRLLGDLNSVSASLFSEQSFSWNPMVSGLSLPADTSKRIGTRFFGPKEKTLRPEIYKAEIDAVCSFIDSCVENQVPLHSLAVLFRNADRISDFSKAFTERGWAHQCKKSDSLSKHLSAIEIVSYLRFFLDPFRDSELITVLRSKYFNWGYEDILTWLQKRKKNPAGKAEPLVQLLKQETPPGLSWLIRLLESGETEIKILLETLFFETGQFPESREVFDALLKPLSAPGLSVFDVRFLLDSFQDSEYLFQEQSSPTEQLQGIQLMTVHASKGLEFENVLLVDTVRQLPSETSPLLLKAGLPPGIRFWEKEKKVLSGSYQGLLEERKLKDQEESKRILYVAMTRAKKSLTVFMPFESAIAYPKNSWADLLAQAGVGERAANNTTDSAPSPLEIEYH